MSKQGHNWSGWPGAFCTRCHMEQAQETALGLGWLHPGCPAFGSEPEQLPEWKAECYRQYAEAHDGECPADMTEAEQKVFFAKIRELNAAIELFEKGNKR